MQFIQSTFDWAGDLYNRWFSNWLHIHFIIRTVIILLALWLIIYVAIQIFQYIIAPLFVLFYYHVIFRLWNFLFVETPQEWIYIKYHSKDKPNFNETYSNLCDKLKKNQMVLSRAKYSGIIYRGNVKSVAVRLMIILCVVATLWVTAFGLHHEYAAQVWVDIENENNTNNNNNNYPPLINNENNVNNENEEYSGNNNENIYNEYNGVEELPYIYDDIPPSYPPTYAIYSYGYVNPALWDANTNIQLQLNELGSLGARLRDAPSIANATIIGVFWDSEVFIYLHEYIPDRYVRGLYWLYVLAPNGVQGFISSQVIEVI